jgi:hypothetical protein
MVVPRTIPAILVVVVAPAGLVLPEEVPIAFPEVTLGEQFPLVVQAEPSQVSQE